MNKIANFVLNTFPSLRGVIPSTEHIISDENNEYHRWIEIPFKIPVIRKHDAIVAPKIISFDFIVENGVVKPELITPLKGIFNEEYFTKYKIVLLECSLHPIACPTHSDISFEYFINNKKHQIKISQSDILKCVPNDLYSLDKDLEYDIISACGKENILETIKEYKSKKKIIKTVENEKYLMDHGNVKLHKDTFLCKILDRHRNWEWDNNRSVNYYKVRDQPNYVCFKRNDLKLIKKGLKTVCFDKIEYMTEDSLKIRIGSLTPSMKNGRLNFMLRMKFAIAKEKELYNDEGFQEM